MTGTGRRRFADTKDVMNVDQLTLLAIPRWPTSPPLGVSEILYKSTRHKRPLFKRLTILPELEHAGCSRSRQRSSPSPMRTFQSANTGSSIAKSTSPRVMRLIGTSSRHQVMMNCFAIAPDILYYSIRSRHRYSIGFTHDTQQSNSMYLHLWSRGQP